MSGLTGGATPSLGVYDIVIQFDSSILSFTSVVFGDPVLGDQLSFDFPSISNDTSIAGGVNVFELSLDSAASLATLQADAFTLATLSFNAIALGTSAITPNINVLGDEFGDPLFADEVLGSAVSAVPEPSSAILFVVGMLVAQRGLQRKR